MLSTLSWTLNLLETCWMGVEPVEKAFCAWERLRGLGDLGDTLHSTLLEMLLTGSLVSGAP